jgi:hypothetical protein
MSTVKTCNQQCTIDYINDEFAGRTNMSDYDESKLIHIHRRNRPYVWSHKMQVDFLDSILKGYYIPPIICGAKNNKLFVMEGGNRITTIRRIMNNQVRALTDAERVRITNFNITLVSMKNLTPKQEREMFRRLNKSIKVSDGQLYAMSEEDSPLIKAVLEMLNSTNYTLRARITEMFYDTVDNDNDGRANLANAVAIISGILYGPKYITKSYARQEERVDAQDPVNKERIVNILSIILSIFEQANVEEPLTDKKKKKVQFTVGYMVGSILYDILTNDDVGHVFDKWVRYIVMVRRGVDNANEALEIKGAQNIDPNKLKKKCFRVSVFVNEGRIATEDELKQVKHIQIEEEDEEEDEEDDENNGDDDASN